MTLEQILYLLRETYVMGYRAGINMGERLADSQVDAAAREQWEAYEPLHRMHLKHVLRQESAQEQPHE